MGLDAEGAIETHHNNIRTTSTEITTSRIDYIKSLNVFCEVLDNVQTADLTVPVTVRLTKLTELGIFSYGVRTGSEHVICRPEVCDSPPVPIPSLKSVKFLYGLGHPNFANKIFKFSLADLFPSHWQSDSYKLRLSATLFSINVAQVNLTFQEGEDGQRYKILQGIFKGEEAHSDTIDVLVPNVHDSKDIRIVSVMTVNKTYQFNTTRVFPRD